MESTLVVNWWVIIAIIALIIGIVAVVIGVIAGMDPEGRGGKYIWLFFAGVGVAGSSAIYLLYRLGAVLGFWS